MRHSIRMHLFFGEKTKNVKIYRQHSMDMLQSPHI